jgi:peroxiredoxin
VKRIVWWLAGVAMAIAGVLLYDYFGGGSAAVGPASLAGHSAPSFTVSDLGGRPTALADFRGRVVVLNLWASWCPPCRAEMPDLERLYRTYRARNVVVLGVDQGEAAARASSFAHSLGITYTILVDEAQSYGRVYKALGLPTTFIIDRDGTVVRGFDGPLTYDQMRAAVAPVIDTK